jgi:dipeptidyl-peptidase-4
VFDAGVAVAPVTDWRLYDSIYTERYLERPQDNEDGYRESSPVHFADDFDGRLLVMHGDADDNVHFQHTVRLVKRLIGAGKDFDVMLFPQKRHGIRGDAERVFLYRRMTRFFETHLQHAGETVP